jgi:hypothetical protein
MQIVPPVMIIRTLASGSATWRNVVYSPILGRFGLPAGSKRLNELGAGQRGRVVGNEYQGRSEQGLLCCFCFGLRISRYQRKNEYKGDILAAQRPCKRKVQRKLMNAQTRLASLDINWTSTFNSRSQRQLTIGRDVTEVLHVSDAFTEVAVSFETRLFVLLFGVSITLDHLDLENFIAFRTKSPMTR